MRRDKGKKRKKDEQQVDQREIVRKQTLRGEEQMEEFTGRVN